MKPLVILVAGGTASGKSTVVSEVLDKSGLNDCVIIKHDDYYKDLSNSPFEERTKINFDHPDSLDNELLLSHINDLLNNKTIQKPTYDFTTYTRSDKVELVKPKKVVIIEGILLLENEDIRKYGDILIFVDCDDDLRFIRRLKRDINERGRSVDSVIKQYINTVKPMHQKYVSPSKRHADIIILNDRKHDVAVDLIVARINKEIKE